MSEDQNQEEVVTLIFENAANENKKWQIVAVSEELMRDYVGRAAKQLFTPVPQRVGIATKDGAIIQNWADKTVRQVMEEYQTNHIVLGTPDQLGDPLSFLTADTKKLLVEWFNWLDDSGYRPGNIMEKNWIKEQVEKFGFKLDTTKNILKLGKQEAHIRISVGYEDEAGYSIGFTIESIWEILSQERLPRMKAVFPRSPAFLFEMTERAAECVERIKTILN
jgi:hypothetical protein